MRKNWIDALAKHNPLNIQEIKETSFVCSEHFTQECYVKWGKSKRLDTMAIPFVFPTEFDGDGIPPYKKTRISSG